MTRYDEVITEYEERKREANIPENRDDNLHLLCATLELYKQTIDQITQTLDEGQSSGFEIQECLDTLEDGDESITRLLDIAHLRLLGARQTEEQKRELNVLFHGFNPGEYMSKELWDIAFDNPQSTAGRFINRLFFWRS